MVVVFGSINLDLVAQVPHIPVPGETVAGSAFATAPGGKGANQALAARDAGADVALYGAVGDDAFAAPALLNLKTAGVELAGIATVAGPTGIALINVSASGENAISVVPGANAAARSSQVPTQRLRRGATLLMQLEVPAVEVQELASRARRSGARVVLNAAPAERLHASLLRDLDVLIVNEQEAAVYAAAWSMPVAPAAFLAHVKERFGVTVVLTLGKRGAMAHAGDGPVHAAAPRVDVVDTTGAGDALAGAFAAALDRGEPLAAALSAGVRAGAEACRHGGAQRTRAATQGPNGDKVN